MDHYVATSILSALLELDCCPGGPFVMRNIHIPLDFSPEANLH